MRIEDFLTCDAPGSIYHIAKHGCKAAMPEFKDCQVAQNFLETYWEDVLQIAKRVGTDEAVIRSAKCLCKSAKALVRLAIEEKARDLMDDRGSTAQKIRSHITGMSLRHFRPEVCEWAFQDVFPIVDIEGAILGWVDGDNCSDYVPVYWSEALEGLVEDTGMTGFMAVISEEDWILAGNTWASKPGEEKK